MVPLDGATDYVWLFLTSAICGGIGGIAFELLQSRRGQQAAGDDADTTGWLRLPYYQRGAGPQVELGFLSSMILGAVAAVAIAYFFTPEAQVKETVAGLAVIRTKWQIAKVVPLSLIVGSAGGAFLAAMESRVIAKVNAEKVESAKEVGKANVESAKEVGKANAALIAQSSKAEVNDALVSLASSIGPRVEQSVREAASAVPDGVHERIVAAVPEAAEVLEDVLQDLPTTSPSTAVAEINAAVLDALESRGRQATERIDKQLGVAQESIEQVSSE